MTETNNQQMELRKEKLRKEITSVVFTPINGDVNINSDYHFSIPFSKLAALGIGIEAIKSQLELLLSSSNGGNGLYHVIVAKGTHLAKLKNGKGFIGGTLDDKTNSVAGQGILTPAEFDPTMLLIAVALGTITQKLESIEDLQQKMMDYLIQRDHAELTGDMKFLSNLHLEYRYNWDNPTYKHGAIVKIMDILQETEQKMDFYQVQIQKAMEEVSFLHLDKDVKKQIRDIQTNLKDYQLALYLFSFSTYMKVVLTENFDPIFLKTNWERIEDYAFNYRELYTNCYYVVEKNTDESIQGYFLKGLAGASTWMGNMIEKIPAFAQLEAGKNMLEIGEKFSKTEMERNKKLMTDFIQVQGLFVHPFVEGIQTIDRIYNQDLELLIDQNGLYLPLQEA